MKRSTVVSWINSLCFFMTCPQSVKTLLLHLKNICSWNIFKASTSVGQSLPQQKGFWNQKKSILISSEVQDGNFIFITKLILNQWRLRHEKKETHTELVKLHIRSVYSWCVPAQTAADFIQLKLNLNPFQNGLISFVFWDTNLQLQMP